jgi:hypothetical protein
MTGPRSGRAKYPLLSIHVFDGGWFGSSLKGFALFVLYMVVLGNTAASVFTYAAMRL